MIYYFTLWTKIILDRFHTQRISVVHNWAFTLSKCCCCWRVSADRSKKKLTCWLDFRYFIIWLPTVYFPNLYSSEISNYFPRHWRMISVDLAYSVCSLNDWGCGVAKASASARGRQFSKKLHRSGRLVFSGKSANLKLDLLFRSSWLWSLSISVFYH